MEEYKFPLTVKMGNWGSKTPNVTIYGKCPCPDEYRFKVFDTDKIDLERLLQPNVTHILHGSAGITMELNHWFGNDGRTRIHIHYANEPMVGMTNFTEYGLNIPLDKWLLKRMLDRTLYCNTHEWMVLPMDTPTDCYKPFNDINGNQTIPREISYDCSFAVAQPN